MTELETAHLNWLRIKELDAEILKHKEFQLSCKAARDNIGEKAWVNRIAELKNERNQLDSVGRYLRFTLFTQVVKTYLTKDQYHEAWNRVEQILECPELMQP